MSRSSPKYVNSGSYGCVFRPSFDCTGKRGTSKHVSKIFNNIRHAEEEYEIHRKIVDEIDPKHKFTLYIDDKCAINKASINIEEITKCKNKPLDNNLYQIVYEYGGDELYTAVTVNKFFDVLKGLQSIFYGITQMTEKEYTHLDIKPDNIVYNKHTKKAALIDFGLCRKFKDIYSETFIIKFDYKYYPPEFQAYYFYYYKTGKEFYQPKKHRLKYIHMFANQILLEHEMYDYLLQIASTLKTNQLLKVLERITKPQINTFYKFLETENMRSVPKYADRIDVYMFGVTLLECFYTYVKYNVENRKNDFFAELEKPFYVDLLKIIQKMMHFSPNRRVQANAIYKTYTRFLKKHSSQ